MDDGEIVRFGKDDDRSQTPKVSTGLLDIGSDIPALEKIA
jgi:hypothetical protein